MINPARVLERLNRAMTRGAWERIERRRAKWVAEFGEPDREVSWWYYDLLLTALLDEIDTPARLRMAGGDMSTMHLISAAANLLNWRMTRGVYDFDEELRAALKDTEIHRIPADILRRLPEYSPYLTLNGYHYGGESIHGAWVMRCIRQDGESDQLNAVLHYGHDSTMTLILDLNGATLSECIDNTLKVTRSNLLKARLRGMKVPDMPAHYEKTKMDDDRRLWAYLLSLMLYLCSDEPDITGLPLAPQKSPKKKFAHVILPPQRDNILKVGYAYGGAIRMWRQSIGQGRRSDSDGIGQPKAPHLRKAHYHLYWVGKGRMTPRLNWLPPIAVNVKNIDDMPAYVRPVLDDPGEDRNADSTWARDNGVVLDRLGK